MSDVLAEIKVERTHQDAMWGGPAHDDEHTLEEWFNLINDRFFNPDRLSLELTRRHLIEIAAIAVAAVESIDRTAS